MTAPLPLSGVRVLDLSRVLSGPFCTLVLADLGADVIKVEPPGGEETRRWGPFLPDDNEHAYGGYFASTNRSKRGIALDLKSEADRAVFLRLVDTADVLVENFRPGVMERLGLSWELLHARNPRLVYAAIRGFGDPRTGASPYADWPSFDIVAQAMGGLASITGPGPGTPLKAGPGIGDLFPGVLMSTGICAALREVALTGHGCMLDVALVDAVLALCERIVYQHSYTGRSPTPQGNSHPVFCPFDLFGTRDGHVAIAAVTTDQRELVAVLTGVRTTDDDRLRADLAAWCADRSTAQVLSALGGRVPCGPVNDAQALSTDPHVAARGMLIELEHAGSPTPGTYAAAPLRVVGRDPRRPFRAPRLDEHRAELLAELPARSGSDALA